MCILVKSILLTTSVHFTTVKVSFLARDREREFFLV